MALLQDDALHKVVEVGIKSDIDLLLANDRWRAAAILIFAGIDSMAWLGMPESQQKVTKVDFVGWADRYIRFPCRAQVNGEELYTARCGMLHTSGPESDGTRAGKCRMIGYTNRMVPEVRFDARIDPTLVLVSVQGLRDAFFAGVNQFLIASLADSTNRTVFETRLEKMVQTFPVGDPKPLTEGAAPSSLASS